ncbi:MAG TPA: 6-phosphogluconolactonase [Solirubrobacteraceae bacterium]|nr:6-phosphogluconolactonase [Solirubrobacteraceae bacterium]
MIPAPPAPLVLGDPRRVGLLAAELVLNRLTAWPRARLLLPTGRSPTGMYAALRAHAAAGRLRSAESTVLQLDEYAGLRPDDPRSFAARLRVELDGVPVGSLHTLDGAAPDLAAEAARHEELVEGATIELAVLGLGRDGHVAFDEPPARLASGVRRVTLAPETRVDAAATFGGLERVPSEALTVGLGTLARVRELILLVSGAAKAPALRAMLEEPVSVDCPASLLRDHARLTVICDSAAAHLLTPRPQFESDRVLIVLGHREPGVSAEHRISSQSRKRLRHARRIAQRAPVRAAVLTGYTTTGGLSEAEQMKATWDEHAAPALLEVAGRNTAENASRSLPIVLALGDVGHVTVVSTAWHLRVPWFFAPFRRFGLRVSYRASFAQGSWSRMVRHELREARHARAERRSAMESTHRPPPLDVTP